MKMALLFLMSICVFAAMVSADTLDFKSDETTEFFKITWQPSVPAWLHPLYDKYIDIPATWIWRTERVTEKEAVKGSSVNFRKHVEVPACAENITGQITLTSDNYYKLRINGKTIATDDDWYSAETYDISNRLKPGQNEILILARNEAMKRGTPSTNPAALIFVGSIDYDCREPEVPEFSTITALIALAGAVCIVAYRRIR